MKRVLTWLERACSGSGSGELLALLGGALLPLGLAPLQVWPATILGPALLLLCLRGQNTRRALLRGWLFGVGLYGVGASWVYVSIHQYGYAPPWLAGSLTALFVAGLALMAALLGACWQRFFRTGTGSWMIAFPAVWVLIEWLRAWLLTGFPWLYAGYAHVDSALSGYAPVVGIYGVGFASVLCSGALATILRADIDRGGRILALLLSGLVFGVGVLLQQPQWTEAVDTGPLRVAVVQGNVPQDLKWQRDNLLPTLALYRGMNRRLRDSDLVVWPEAAIPTYADRVPDYLEAVQRELPPGATLLTGVPSRHGYGSETRYFNSILALGQGDGIYHKQKLVPFGEYVPLEQWLRGLIRFFDLPMSAFSSGPPGQQPLRVLHQDHVLQIAAFICYEVVYPDFAVRQQQDTQLLLTISNDAWFGSSWGPWQHFQMARMRALELGRPLIRSTNNGISALIDHRGQVRQVLPQFEQAILTGEVQPRQGTTPFGSWGSGPLLVSALLLALLLRRRAVA